MARTRRIAKPVLSSPVVITPVTLLVVSSDRKINGALHGPLEANGFSILSAHTGKQALKLVYQHRPHLVILDGALLDIGRRIKADETLGFVPVILLTEPGESWHDDEPDSGADVALAKPIDLDELQATIRFMLRIKRQIDHLIRENQKLAGASRALEVLKADIIRNVMHEFRTPLVQVKAAVALLAEDIEKTNNRDQIKMANMATQAVARLEGVVENFRQLAQTHNIVLTPVAVQEAVDLAIRHIERSWESRGGRDRIETFIDPDLPLIVADKRATARLLQLLLDNALKFSQPNTPVYILAQRHGDFVWIGVQDFGIGIAEEDHERIFEAFYQVDPSITRTYGGTGVGLALAMLLANGMNARIHVQSKLHKGSTFSFRLPISNGDEFEDL